MADVYGSSSLEFVAIRSDEVGTFLEGIEYPATKREILDIAYDNGAPDHILEFLNSLEDREYVDEVEIISALENLQMTLIS